MSEGIGRRVGVLGGGQLGRMMGYAAGRLGVDLVILDPMGADSPGGKVTPVAVTGSFQEAEMVLELSKKCDVITAEIEHVNCEGLLQLEAQGFTVRPSAKVIQTIQDKQLQKEVLSSHGVPVVNWLQVEANVASVFAAVEKLGGFPAMLKSRKQAYDGRGNYVLRNESDIAPAVEKLNQNVGGLYLEQWCPFKAEIAVMVARSAATGNEMVAYDVVETRQKDNICHVVVAPPTVELSAAERAQAEKIALDAVTALDGIGIFGVEMFLLPDGGGVVLNEMAPRPHNSGHFTMDSCVTDQFEQHLRAVLGMKLGDASMMVPAGAMVNILGFPTEAETHAMINAADGKPGTSLHWYGKAGHREGRKLGHINVTANSMAQLRARMASIGQPLFPEDAERAVAESTMPLVGVIMGSDSDLPTMQAACKVLDHFGVSYECTVVSAHRTPTRMYEYAQSAKTRGLRCIIAGAGGAAHLPGMVAALTPLPVIGVPVKSSTLSGNDSLLSIVQMPRGVPVATVAIGNAMNAGLLAVRTLAAFDPPLASKLDAWHREQETSVHATAAKLENQGYAAYLEEYAAGR